MNKSRMLSKEDEDAADVQVTRADQDDINAFSSLHSKQARLEEELAEKKQEKEYVSDVTLELELADDDDTFQYKVGDAFIRLPLPTVNEMLEKSSKELDDDIERLEGLIEGNKETMKGLKVKLYSKFGRSINLDV